jgi:hypothetical protein
MDPRSIRRPILTEIPVDKRNPKPMAEWFAFLEAATIMGLLILPEES